MIFWAKSPTGRTDYVTTRPARWTVDTFDGFSWELTIPAGFVFQFSVPRWLEWAFDPHDAQHLEASAFHDWSLALDGSRGTSALVFYRVLHARGVGRWKAGAMAFATLARAPRGWR